MPTSSRLLFLLVIGLLAAGWMLGLIRVHSEEGTIEVSVGRGHRLAMQLDLGGTWLLLILALTAGWSVATAVDRSAWVPGSERLVSTALLATVAGWLMARSALSRTGFVLLGGAAAVVYLVADTLPLVQVKSALATLPGPLETAARWGTALVIQPHIAGLVALLALVLLSGLWMGWWVFRRRAGLAGLLPSGTALAVEVLNDPTPALYFFTLLWLVCALLLLLRLHFLALKERWRARRIPRGVDTGWTFGEIGFEATALLLLVAFMLPPLSSDDISSFLFSGSLLTGQAHPFGIGASRASTAPGEVGYSETVRPGSSLKAKSQTIMVVRGDAPFFYPYWRGIALAGWDGIQWYSLPGTSLLPVWEAPAIQPKQALPRDDLPPDSNFLELAHDTFHLLVPAAQTLSTVFSGGEVIWVDKHPVRVRGIISRGTLVVQPLPEGPAASAYPEPQATNLFAESVSFDTVDRVRLADTPKPPYVYDVYEASPRVDAQSLRQDSTDYPAWITPYLTLYWNGRVDAGYSTVKDADIAQLTQQIVTEAHASNPYDQAKAIEAWFRVKDRFTYTLTPPPAPAGVRPLDYFLFQSKRGFCQDFSTAMAVMLRTLHIPVRQMSGFGQGNYDDRTRQFVVNALDAHTWVEVYFPGYGWIPFEPTPDGANAPINRPETAAALSAEEAIPVPSTSRDRPESDQPPGAGQGQGSGSDFWSGLWGKAALVVAGLLLVTVLAGLAFLRWLTGAREVPAIWRRLRFLGDRLHVPRRSGDTPSEYGARLAEAVPPLEKEVQSLARLYTRARYRQGGLAAEEQGEVQTAWKRVRRTAPGLLAQGVRRRIRRLEPFRPAEASASESRGPGVRRVRLPPRRGGSG